jgi:hypothetical protein
VVSRRFLLIAVSLIVLLAGCELTPTPSYTYEYIPGHTATVDGTALANPPMIAPFVVRQAIAAGNDLIGKPYRYGGGHRDFYDDGYDCSGAVSYVLHSIGRLETPTPSDSFRSYGERGPGRWITVYATRGHVFMVVAGLRFDTGYGEQAHGPHWLTRSRPAGGYVMRHPVGL